MKDQSNAFPAYHNILKPGTSVLVGEKIPARVTQVLISEQMVITYKCSYWDGNSFKNEWFNNWDIEPTHKTDSVTIGFKQ